MNLPIHHIKLVTILTVPAPSFKERLAVSELRRGLYQFGGAGPLVGGDLPGPAAAADELRFVLSAGRLASEEYDIAAAQAGPLTTVTIAGAGEQALLYGVFDFLERQGAFFGVDSD